MRPDQHDTYIQSLPDIDTGSIMRGFRSSIIWFRITSGAEFDWNQDAKAWAVSKRPSPPVPAVDTISAARVEKIAAERSASYVYLGGLTSRSMTLTVRKINSIDAGGTWVTVWDEEDMESEVELPGMTPEMIRAAMEEWGY